MNRNITLFIGDIESPWIIDVIEKLLLLGKEVVVSIGIANLIKDNWGKQIEIQGRIKTWSWNEKTADYYIGDFVMEVIPYIYPNTIDPALLKRVWKKDMISKKTYKNIRLGFGVQEELFDLFLADVIGANEIVYFDIMTSMQLLNPTCQLEFRRRSYEFFSYVDMEIDNLKHKELVKKKYRLVGPIPFYEEFSERYLHLEFVFHYFIRNRE